MKHNRINKNIFFAAVLFISLTGLVIVRQFNNIEERINNVVSSTPQLNTQLLTVTPEPSLTIFPDEAVQTDYEIPSIAEYTSAELDMILTIRPGITTKIQVEKIIGGPLRKGTRGEYVHSIKVNSGEKELSSAGVYFYFEDNNIVKKVHYYNSDFAVKGQADFTNIMGVPNMIYTRSPSNSNYVEYVYSSKGVTFLLNDNEIESITLYKPKTLQQYVEDYEDMLPYDVSL